MSEPTEQPIESQPGVIPGAGEEGEQQNVEGVEQAEKPPDVQDFAREQAERNQRDIEAGNPTPDRPATPANLAAFHQERAKTEQEDAASEQAKKASQVGAQNEAAEGEDEGEE